MPACCVSGCKNQHTPSGKVKLYKIPSASRSFQAKRRQLWLQAIQRVNGSTEELRGSARVCGAHFISGKASMDQDSPDFVPSVFTSPSSKKKVKWFYGRRKKRHRTAKVKTVRVDSPVDLHSSVLMEEMQMPSTPSGPKEGERWTEVAETELETKTIKLKTTSSPNKASSSLNIPADIHKLDKKIPIVRLKPVFVPAFGYLCEHCSQKFTKASQLLKHIWLHEEETSFICEICGQHFTSRADFTEHQLAHEPCFPCNMCERSFTTSHNLKRHKLLHVKDGRKCQKCGVLFCRRHNHVLFMPQAEFEQDADQKNDGGNVMIKNDLHKEPELNQTSEDNDEAPSSTSAAPSSPSAPLSKIKKARRQPCHKEISLNNPVPVLLSPVPPPPTLKYPNHQHISTQRWTLPDYPANFVQPHLPQQPQLPPSLNIFSPQYLTSALLEVKRDYEYILSKPKAARSERQIVKEEQCELPLISPAEQRVKHIKKEKNCL
ncbi:hypothetical protein L3Q82_015909 [Scortum barcoo]|uniref:Uncharacterized protein n=1 Tax=Scortum barcoo TaxID=214431 RepID=A0ACB8VPE9_9TELE|nr:hypothetical protein L3Q82_015909 [Scortum barcoo]